MTSVANNQSHVLKNRETAIHFWLERVSVIQSSLLLKIKKLKNFKAFTQKEEKILLSVQVKVVKRVVFEISYPGQNISCPGAG